MISFYSLTVDFDYGPVNSFRVISELAQIKMALSHWFTLYQVQGLQVQMGLRRYSVKQVAWWPDNEARGISRQVAMLTYDPHSVVLLEQVH